MFRAYTPIFKSNRIYNFLYNAAYGVLGAARCRSWGVCALHCKGNYKFYCSWRWACKPEACRAKINKYCIKLVINSYLNQMQGTTIQNTFYVQWRYFRKSCRLWYIVEKCGRTRHATDGNIKGRMRFSFRINKTQTHFQNICDSLSYHCNNGCANTPHCYIIPTLRILCYFCTVMNTLYFPNANQMLPSTT